VTSLVLAALLVAAPADPLSALQLRLATAKRTLLAGEPLRLELTWTTTAPVYVDGDARFFVASPDGVARQWHEAEPEGTESMARGAVLGPGERLVTAHVLAATGSLTLPASPAVPPVSHLALAFPIPGRYRVQARHAPAASNWLDLEVVPPAGAEAEVHDFIRAHPWVLTPYVTQAQPAGLDAMLRGHPMSVYFARTRLLLWDRKFEKAYLAAPEVPGPIPSTGDVPAVLDEIARATLPGAFEEDRLSLLLQSAASATHQDRALVAWRELLARFPSGAAVDQARRARLVVTQPRD
jgi:hypothetical protein